MTDVNRVTYPPVSCPSAEVGGWVRLVVEQCWLGLHQDPGRGRREILVRKSCPVGPSVAMIPRTHHHTTGFHYTVSCN